MAGNDSYTKFLSHWNGPDGSKEIIDSGNTGHIVTQVGTATTSTAQKKIGNCSILLDGNSDYLTVPDHADWTFGTDPFTMEFWVRFASVTDACLLNSISAGDTGWFINYDNTGHVIKFASLAASTYAIGFSTPFTAAQDTWYHIAVVRVNTDNADTAWRTYIDGVAGTLTKNNGNWNGTIDNIAQTVRFGADPTAFSSYLNGYMDEIRISGVARYTDATFTPSTVPFTSDANTKLLLHCESQDVGSGGSFNPLTFVGTAQIDTYTTPVNNQVFTNTSASIGTGYQNYSFRSVVLATGMPDASYTQFRVKFVAPASENSLYINLAYIGQQNTTDKTDFAASPAKVKLTFSSSDSATISAGQTLWSDWVTFSNDGTHNLIVGADTGNNNYVAGNASAGDGYSAHSSADIVNNTSAAALGASRTYLFTTVEAKTTASFGTGSLLLDGNSDYVTAPDNADWSFGTGDFTIDFWLRLGAIGAGQGLVEMQTDANNRFWMYVDDTGNKVYLSISVSSSVVAAYNCSTALVANTWYHVALVRSGTTIYFFLNGIDVTTTTTAIGATSIPNFTGPLYIGAYEGSGNYLNGYIDELRISKGIARWTADFTPPTAEYDSLTGGKKWAQTVLL